MSTVLSGHNTYASVPVSGTLELKASDLLGHRRVYVPECIYFVIDLSGAAEDDIDHAWSCKCESDNFRHQINFCV
jgi:hypothetical protein